MVYDVGDLDAQNPDKAAQSLPKAKATAPRVTVFCARLKDGIAASGTSPRKPASPPPTSIFSGRPSP